MKVTFLGTSAMLPTKERGHTAIFVSYKTENVLVDCGENVQRQLRIAKIAPSKISMLLITHFHGDHFFGFPGLVENLSKSNYNRVLKIYGPKGTREFIGKVMDVFRLEGKIKLDVNDIGKDGVFYDGKDLVIEAYELDHLVNCLGYAIREKDTRKIDVKYVKKLGIPQGPILGKLQQGKDIQFKGKTVKASQTTYVKPGKRIGIILDTRLCDGCYKIAKDCNLVICEATFLSEMEEKAGEFGHLSARQAGMIAKKANVERLVLTHFSQRYKEIKTVEAEAKKEFKNSSCAEDFLIVDV